MVGKLHKKKFENEENEENQENERDEGDEESDKQEEEEDHGSASENGDGDDAILLKCNDSVTGNDDEAGGNEEPEDNDNDDDDYKSIGEAGDDDADSEKSSKKTKKRKAVERAAKKEKAIVEDDSDEEPLNGSVSPKKKSRKTAAKNTKGGGKGKAKKAAKAKNDDDDEEEEEEEEEYEVKDIVDNKTERGVVYYLIRWKGYTKDDDTWEAENTLSCPDIIERYKSKKKQSGSKKAASPAKKGKAAGNKKTGKKEDTEKEWEVEKIIDYADEKKGRVFRIRWKGFGPKFDTWEPQANLNCDDIIDKFLEKMKSQENISFKELREETKKPKRLVNETALRTSFNNPIGRKSKRAVTKKRVFYGDMDE